MLTRLKIQDHIIKLRHIVNKKNEIIIKKSPNKEPSSFTGKFYQIFFKNLTIVLHKLLWKNGRWGNIFCLIFEAKLIFIPKLDKHFTRNKTKQLEITVSSDLDANIFKILRLCKRWYCIICVKKNETTPFTLSTRINSR